MFFGILNNPKGLTAKELFYYLERVVAHGDGESIVYASSKPVIRISCDPTCVLMEIEENKENKEEVIKCFACKYSRPIDRTKSPEKYFREDCIVCECEDVVGDEYMIYPEDHYCGYGKGRYEDE